MSTRIVLFKLVVVSLLGLLGIAHAQSTREELVAAGAKTLTAPELREILSGGVGLAWTAVAGEFAGNKFEWKLDKDGSFAGLQIAQDWRATNQGRWNVNDQGQFCVSNGYWSVPGWASGKIADGCREYLRLGADLFSVGALGRVVKVTVTKL